MVRSERVVGGARLLRPVTSGQLAAANERRGARRPVNAIQLLCKAGQIVDELARLGPLSAAELAKAVSEPRPSVYRIVAALEQIDVVRAAGDGRVELGTALLRWSDAAVESFVNRDSLRKQLRWVRDQLGMNVYFCVAHRGRGAVSGPRRRDRGGHARPRSGADTATPRRRGVVGLDGIRTRPMFGTNCSPQLLSSRSPRTPPPPPRRFAPSSTRSSRGGGVWMTARSSRGWPRSRSRYGERTAPPQG